MRLSVVCSFVTFVAVLSFVGCGGPQAPAQHPTASYAGPIGSTDAALGAEAFRTHCNDCHPGGEHGYGPKLNGEQLDPAVVRQHVREGKGRMPAFATADLSDAALEAILAHLVTTGAVVDASAAPTPATATPTGTQ